MRPTAPSTPQAAHCVNPARRHNSLRRLRLQANWITQKLCCGAWHFSIPDPVGEWSRVPACRRPRRANADACPPRRARNPCEQSYACPPTSSLSALAADPWFQDPLRRPPHQGDGPALGISPALLSLLPTHTIPGGAVGGSKSSERLDRLVSAPLPFFLGHAAEDAQNLPVGAQARGAAACEN